MDIIKVIKDFVQKQKNRGVKKNTEYLAIVLAIGVILIIASGTFGGNEHKEVRSTKENGVDSNEIVAVSSLLTEKYYKASEIENIFSKISGAGRVEIIITYIGSVETIPALNEKTTQSITNEKDNTGGMRNLKQENLETSVIFEDNGKTKKPYIIKELYPVPKGIVIVADGADDFVVKENLIRAAQALLDLPLHKIQVFKRK